MSLAFHELAAEVASLCSDFKGMEKFSDTVIEHSYYLLLEAVLTALELTERPLIINSLKTLSLASIFYKTWG
jgi:hypothetical protein